MCAYSNIHYKMEDTSLISLVLAIASILSNILLHYKLKHCHSICCDSDCYVPTPANSPLIKQPSTSNV